jgi:glycosyltransferase involved in cell wall biosynthesis
MKLAFLDSDKRHYTVQTPLRSPLGGTQSAVCYLARSLANLGHDITLFSGAIDAGKIAGVDHLSSAACSVDQLRTLGFDVIVLISVAGQGAQIRSALPAGGKLILWSQHLEDQPAILPLENPAERDAYDAFAFVSAWQAERYCRAFGIDPARVGIQRNAVGPAFADLADSSAGGDSILGQKANPPVLAYTSAPYRGLNILLQAFPDIRARAPGTRLWIFSSMLGYDRSQQEDQGEFGNLYDLCRRTEGAEYFGALPQPQLAARMKEVAILAYPNTFAETSCIAAMEAMAAGCQIVTTAGGALPETTAGFARLVPAGLGLAEYRRIFVDEVIAALGMRESDPAALEGHLQRQREFVKQNYNWTTIARRWEKWVMEMAGNA